MASPEVKRVQKHRPSGLWAPLAHVCHPAVGIGDELQRREKLAAEWMMYVALFVPDDSIEWKGSQPARWIGESTEWLLVDLALVITIPIVHDRPGVLRVVSGSYRPRTAALDPLEGLERWAASRSRRGGCNPAGELNRHLLASSAWLTV
jgi:hypothetical protein